MIYVYTLCYRILGRMLGAPPRGRCQIQAWHGPCMNGGVGVVASVTGELLVCLYRLFCSFVSVSMCCVIAWFIMCYSLFHCLFVGDRGVRESQPLAIRIECVIIIISCIVIIIIAIIIIITIIIIVSWLGLPAGLQVHHVIEIALQCFPQLQASRKKHSLSQERESLSTIRMGHLCLAMRAALEPSIYLMLLCCTKNANSIIAITVMPNEYYYKCKMVDMDRSVITHVLFVACSPVSSN